MSYLVLARKYRPKQFADMVGQEHVVRALEHALSSQRLHHAYLFTGTRGVGKTTVSRILAKSLNCTGPDGRGDITPTPCGVCPACTDIDSGRFVDYTELDAASNRGVDEVQALLEQAVYKPVQGRFKVFMIDEVHMLTGHAFNAMLKTLEEPPSYLKFVLATTDPQKVPVTVLSRCLQFNLRPMAPQTVFEHLSRVLAAEGVGAEPGALRLLARAARGSMRDALSLTDQALAYGGGQLQELQVRQMLGTVDRAAVLAIIAALAQGDGAAVVHTVDALRQQGLSAASALEEMTQVLQRMAVAQLTPLEPDPADPDAEQVLQLAAQLPPDQTQLLYHLCLNGRTELGLAPDEYSALVMVLLRLLAFRPEAASAVGERLEEKKNRFAQRLSAPVPPKGVQPPASGLAARAGSAPAAGQAQRPAEAEDGVAAVAAAAVSPAAVAQQAAGASALEPPGPARLADGAHAAADAPVPDTDGPPGTGGAAGARQQVFSPAAPRAGGEGLAEGGAQGQAAPGAASGGGAADGVADLAGFWHETVQAMVRAQTIGALVRELALQSQLLRREPVPGGAAGTERWWLRVGRQTLNQPSHRQRLQQALAQHGHTVELVVEVGETADTPAQRAAALSRQRLQQARESVLADPFVQQMVREFGGTIVAGSLQPLPPA